MGNNAAGTTWAASGLRYSNGNYTSFSGTPNGTWRVMGYSAYGASSTLYIRIS